MVRIVPYAGISFTTNEHFKSHLSKDGHLSHPKRFLAGSLAGVSASSMTYVLEVRLMVGQGTPCLLNGGSRGPIYGLHSQWWLMVMIRTMNDVLWIQVTPLPPYFQHHPPNITYSQPCREQGPPPPLPLPPNILISPTLRCWEQGLPPPTPHLTSLSGAESKDSLSAWPQDDVDQL